MHPSETLAASVIIVVHVVSLVLAVLAFAAWRRNLNHRLLFVGLAFTLFAAKSLLTAYSLTSGFLHHEDLEAVGALFDLGVVLLLVAPFIVRSHAKT